MAGSSVEQGVKGPLLETTSDRLLGSSMDKTPSADREDELCFSEELNVTDEGYTSAL